MSRDYKVPLGAKEIDMLDAVRGMSHAEQEKIARMTNEVPTTAAAFPLPTLCRLPDNSPAPSPPPPPLS